MINRVLIRLKAVQLLYSYLLTENDFTLESQPLPPTKEKRFAYNLYLDVLYLLILISRYDTQNNKSFLNHTRFIRKIEDDERMRTLAIKYSNTEFGLNKLIVPIYDEILKSSVYKELKKGFDENTLESDKFWEIVINTIIYPNPLFRKDSESMENYSIGGVERSKELLQETFKNFYSSRDNIHDGLKKLKISLDKSRELYMRFLALPIEITLLKRQDIEESKHKFLPTFEELNPNTRFIDNGLVKRLEKDPMLTKYLSDNKISWLAEDRQLFSSLLNDIEKSEEYKEYMNFPATDLKADCELWRNLYKNVIFNNIELMEFLETKSVYWNDDVDVVGTFVLKTFKKFADENDPEPVLPMFKDDEDAVFGEMLLKEVIKNKETFRRYIDEALISEKWETERLAFMDVVIIMTALAEILNFPKIPLNVSVNEYIEIAKNYSTYKSGGFINGLLRSIIIQLKEEGVLQKSFA